MDEHDRASAVLRAAEALREMKIALADALAAAFRNGKAVDALSAVLCDGGRPDALARTTKWLAESQRDSRHRERELNEAVMAIEDAITELSAIS